MEEFWRPAYGFEKIYEVSNLGRVRRIAKTSGGTVGYILKPYIMAGYHYVSLCPGHGAKPRKMRLHRIVARTFLGKPPEGKPEVNHKNCDRLDNKVDNLEWVSRSENMLHASKNGRIVSVPPVRYGTENNRAKLTESIVRQVRKLYATGEYSQREIGDMFGVTKTTINNVIVGSTWANVT